MRNEEDLLRRENWAEVYSDVPPCVENGMNIAFNRIRAQRRQARKRWSVVACAACAVLALGVGIWAVQPAGNAPDRIADPHIQAPVSFEPHERILLYADSQVYCTKADDCFHITRQCPDVAEDAVELQIVTALEFGKTACERCAPNAQYDAGIQTDMQQG